MFGKLNRKKQQPFIVSKLAEVGKASSEEQNTKLKHSLDNLKMCSFIYYSIDYISCFFSPLVHIQATHSLTENPITPILAEHCNIFNLNIAQKVIKCRVYVITQLTCN